jgi:hypothetical protein
MLTNLLARPFMSRRDRRIRTGIGRGKLRLKNTTEDMRLRGEKCRERLRASWPTCREPFGLLATLP